MLLILLAPGAAFAKDDCVPPTFYTNLPRDREYYYGVSRDSDTDHARDLAIRNLGKQVTGEVEGWEQAKVDEIAGPGQDRWKVAASVGKLLPGSTLLAGWEQDDFGRCNGYSYVLVRIEKERVERFVRGSAQFKKDVTASLVKRVEKLEADVSAISERLAKLERGLSCIKAAGSGVTGVKDVALTVAEARADFQSGMSGTALLDKLAAAESAYAGLTERMRGYQAGNDKVENARVAALKEANAPRLRELLAVMATDKWNFMAALAVQGIYRDGKEYDALRTFSHGVLNGKNKGNLGKYEADFAYQLIVADMAVKDDKATLADGEYFLKHYQDSNLFTAVKSEMDGVMLMARMPKSAVQPFDPCQSTDKQGQQ